MVLCKKVTDWIQNLVLYQMSLPTANLIVEMGHKIPSWQYCCFRCIYLLRLYLLKLPPLFMGFMTNVTFSWTSLLNDLYCQPQVPDPKQCWTTLIGKFSPMARPTSSLYTLHLLNCIAFPFQHDTVLSQPSMWIEDLLLRKNRSVLGVVWCLCLVNESATC